MKIAIAADHGGYTTKEGLRVVLEEMGHEVKDFGVYSEESIDYPDFAYPAAKVVADGEFDRGVVVCGTGVGVSIVANKVRGIRCALVTSTEVAQLTREHNDSNMLALGGRTTPYETNVEILKTWINTPYSEDARHGRRICKISDIETKEGRE